MRLANPTLSALAASCGWLAAAGPFEPGKEREWDFLDQAKFPGTLVGTQDGMVQIRMADGVVRDFWPGGAEAISATYLQRSVTRLPTKPATPVLKPGTGPVIDLTASALPDGALRQWKNAGRAGGSFTALNQPPHVARVQGRKAVVFEHPPWLLPLEFQSMVSDFIVPETVTRSETLTVVAWLCNLGPVVDRETFFCWGEKDCGELDTPDFSYGCYEAMQWYDEKLTMPPARFPKLGQWHQFAYVITPSNKDRNRLSLELFVNGSRVSGKLVRKPKPQVLANNLAFLGCAWEAWWGHSWETRPARPFTGAIAGLQVYDRALDPAEILKLNGNSASPRETAAAPIASQPAPADGTREVQTNLERLQWQPHPDAVAQVLHFGTDREAVAKGTASQVKLKSHTDEAFIALDLKLPELESGTTYHWRVEPVIDGEQAPSPALWSFTTSEFELEFDGRTKVGEVIGQPGQELLLPVPNARLWTPDDPFLYELDLELVDGPNKDEVKSYFGMRKISIGPDENGITRILLNNKFVFQAGPLDQGFWPDGLYTAPTDAALKYDVEMTKAYGFNMSRKHVKVEPSRWYYWCDKLGVLVWQDMPGSGNKTPAQKEQFETELQRMVEGLAKHPSVIMWVVFNEGWGQYDTERLTETVKAWDPHRLVSNASGWVDKDCGDILDHHTYPVPGAPKPSKDRASVVGEYGGLGYNLKGHMWVDSGWGYQTFNDEESLNARYEEITGVLLERAKDPGISAGVYTQVSDIEVENNGLMTYDRGIFKIKPEVSANALKGLLPPRKTSLPDQFIGSGEIELKGYSDKGRIVYTLDGSEPAAGSKTYDQPITITADTLIKARTVWPDGGMSRVVSFPMKKTTPRAAAAADGLKPGLRVAAYELKGGVSNLPDFTRMQPSNTSVADRVNLKPKPAKDNFGLVFEGFLKVPATGVYLLRVASDDGAQVLVGDQPVCGKDGIHGMEESVGTIALEAGAHPITVRYFQGVGGEGLRLDWAAPGAGFEEIPASAFGHKD